MQPRIDQLTREKHEANRRALQLEEQNRALMAQMGQPPADPAAAPTAPAPRQNVHQLPQNLSPAQVQQLIDEAATVKLNEQAFTERCNTVYQNGMKEDPKFDQAIRNISMGIGGLENHRPLLDAVTSVPGGHKVLAHLGANIEEAQRLASMTPVQMAIEVSRIEQRLNMPPAVPKPSSAPAPINPLTATAPAADPGPDDKGNFKSQADFRAWRKKQRGGR